METNFRKYVVVTENSHPDRAYRIIEPDQLTDCVSLLPGTAHANEWTKDNFTFLYEGQIPRPKLENLDHRYFITPEKFNELKEMDYYAKAFEALDCPICTCNLYKDGHCHDVELVDITSYYAKVAPRSGYYADGMFCNTFGASYTAFEIEAYKEETDGAASLFFDTKPKNVLYTLSDGRKIVYFSNPCIFYEMAPDCTVLEDIKGQDVVSYKIHMKEAGKIDKEGMR